MLSLSDLTKPLTVDEANTSLLNTAKALGLNVTAWQSGSVIRTIFAILARIYSAFTQVAVLAIGGGLLDYAVGGWLTLLALNVYNVPRIEATFASGKLTLTNVGGALYVINVGDLHVGHATSAKSYRNTSGGTLNPASTLILDIEADEVGTASNASAATITVMVTGLLGVTCSNDDAVIGSDQESDPALRQRCREALGVLSPNGPADAYSYVAKSTKRADGTAVDINRVRVSVSSPNGQLTVTIASHTGTPTAQDVIDVNAEIQLKVVPLGITATVIGATGVSIPVTYTAYIDPALGVTTTEAQTLIDAALTAYINNLAIGGKSIITGGQGYVFAAAIRAEIIKASPAVISAVVTVPAADTPLDPTEVATTGTITPDVQGIVQ